MLLALIINPHAANNLAVGENPKLKTNQGFNIFLNEINPVKHCRLEIGCHCHNDILFRINIDHIAAVSDGGIDVLFPVYDPPQIPIVHTPEGDQFAVPALSR